MPGYNPGRYRCKVVAQGFDRLPNDTKTPYFFLEVEPFELLDINGNWGPIQTTYLRQAKLWMKTETSAAQTAQTLRDLGWPGEHWSDLDPGGFSFKGMVVELENQRAPDAEFDKFEFPFSGSGGEPHATNPSVARAMDAMFGQALRGVKAAPKPAPAQAAPDNPPTTEEVVAEADEYNEDSSIPF